MLRIMITHRGLQHADEPEERALKETQGSASTNLGLRAEMTQHRETRRGGDYSRITGHPSRRRPSSSHSSCQAG